MPTDRNGALASFGVSFGPSDASFPDLEIAKNLVLNHDTSQQQHLLAFLRCFALARCFSG